MSRGFAGIGLCMPKCAANVGSVLRAMTCFDAAFLAIGGQRDGFRFEPCCTDTCKTHRHKPVFRYESPVEMTTIGRPYSTQLVVVEIVDSAKPLHKFSHPEQALYVFGPEDGSVPRVITESAQHVVSIPSMQCLNLAMAVNVVLYDRYQKGLRLG